MSTQVSEKSRLQFWIATAIVFIVLLVSKPASQWEFDEPLFFQALHRYDPVAHHPPPPGYPVFITVAKVFRAVIPSDFGALVTLSVIASTAAFALFALAFGAIARSTTAGIVGALLFYLSPAMLVHATLPQSEAGALFLLALALYLLVVRDNEAGFAAALALSVGWRIQFAIIALPMLFASLFVMRQWKPRITALVTFGVVCLVWLGVLIAAVGGFQQLVKFETGQAGYLAAHDAAESRSGWTAPQIAFRFIAHPWGMKYLAFPLLFVAAIGAGAAVRQRLRLAIPLAFAGACYLVFALLYMDPADGVRYAIPFVLVTAVFAGIGAAAVAQKLRITPLALAGVFAAGAMAYTGLMISQRAWSDSPPVRAAVFARSTYGKGAVALYELPLWPHATYYFHKMNPQRIDNGLATYFDKPSVPLFIYADGASSQPGARVFRWLPSDAYSKLTRNHYRITSVIPLPPERRFKPLRGVYPTEREVEGDEWRWLDRIATIQLPPRAATGMRVTLGLPRQSILDTNGVTIVVDGRETARVSLRRDQRITTEVPLPTGAKIVEFRSASSVVPAEYPEKLNFDRRRLAVKLYDFSLRASAAAAAPQAASR